MSDEDLRREFYISHSCEGYSAKVTIEWSRPRGGELPAPLADQAENVADDILSFATKRVRAIVHIMRHRQPPVF